MDSIDTLRERWCKAVDTFTQVDATMRLNTPSHEQLCLERNVLHYLNAVAHQDYDAYIALEKPRLLALGDISRMNGFAGIWTIQPTDTYMAQAEEFIEKLTHTLEKS